MRTADEGRGDGHVPHASRRFVFGSLDVVAARRFANVHAANGRDFADTHAREQGNERSPVEIGRVHGGMVAGRVEESPEVVVGERLIRLVLRHPLAPDVDEKPLDRGGCGHGVVDVGGQELEEIV